MAKSARKRQTTGLRMETLPLEMVEKVACHLSPQDLARCCAVSHSWRDIFNQDRLWRPKCDPALEEPLRTTPCVVKPVFYLPWVEDSALAPVCQWRLTYMREQHLWGNWKQGLYEEEVLKFEYYGEFFRSFLSDFHLIVCCSNNIQIWDISVMPATLVIKLHNPIEDFSPDCLKVSNNMLIVKQNSSIKVYLVDVTNKCITLKCDIPADEATELFWSKFTVKNKISNDGTTVFFAIGCTASNLIIFDFEKSLKLVKTCPTSEQGNVKIISMGSSPLSDDVLVSLFNGKEVLCYIYSPKQQHFLPGPVGLHTIPYDEIDLPVTDICALNKHFVALGYSRSLSIIDYKTNEVVFQIKGLEIDVYPTEFKDGFIFLDLKDSIYYLRMFSLENKTIYTVKIGSNPDSITQPLYDSLNHFCISPVNNHLVMLAKFQDLEIKLVALFNIVGQSLKKAIRLTLNDKFVDVNSSSTRGFGGFSKWLYKSKIYYYW